MYDDGLQVASEEAAFYVLLKPLQGGAIPALFGISSLKMPGAGLLMLELIEGMPLSELDEIAPEVAEAALDALAQVCACYIQRVTLRLLFSSKKFSYLFFCAIFFLERANEILISLASYA